MPNMSQLGSNRCFDGIFKLRLMRRLSSTLLPQCFIVAPTDTMYHPVAFNKIFCVNLLRQGSADLAQRPYCQGTIANHGKSRDLVSQSISLCSFISVPLLLATVNVIT